MRRPTPGAAIATGAGMIAFALFYDFMGIYPYRRRWSLGGGAILEGEEPFRFRFWIVVTIVLGLAAISWGLSRSAKR